MVTLESRGMMILSYDEHDSDGEPNIVWTTVFYGQQSEMRAISATRIAQELVRDDDKDERAAGTACSY